MKRKRGANGNVPSCDVTSEEHFQVELVNICRVSGASFNEVLKARQQRSFTACLEHEQLISLESNRKKKLMTSLVALI